MAADIFPLLENESLSQGCTISLLNSICLDTFNHFYHMLCFRATRLNLDKVIMNWEKAADAEFYLQTKDQTLPLNKGLTSHVTHWILCWAAGLFLCGEVDWQTPTAPPVETTPRCGVHKAWAGRSCSRNTVCAETGPSHPGCVSNARPLLGTRSPLQSLRTACEHKEQWGKSKLGG